MDNEFAIRLRDVTLEIPARRRLPHGAGREADRTRPVSTQVGGRLSFGRGSSTTVTILEGLNLDISRGHRVGVIGPNGAGKSTLLRVMAGIYYPTRGVAESRGTVSTLFPELLGVRPDATGLENIMLTGVLLGMTRKEINGRIPEIIEFTELGDYIYMPLRTYSTGMRTRLVLSIATCIRPDILLVDEVIGVGDKSFRLKAKDRFNEMMTSANTLVVVSQSPEIIREFCTEAIWLEHGQIKAQGEVEEVLHEYAAEVAGLNQEIQSDSEALLAARDKLAGDAALNWSADIPIPSWDGVTVGGNPRRVIRLILSERQLSGTVPPELGALSRLTNLDLHGNLLSGTIPPELGRLSHLKNLNIHTNRLSGAIPPELGQLADIEVLHLHNNDLSGAIPTGLGRLSHLKHLNLHANRLNGTIPPELGQLSNLEALYLHDNELSGAVPGELGRPDSLSSLWLSNNRLGGELPPGLGQLTNLAQLNLHSNRLSGTIPAELGNLGASLKRLRLAGNRFTGCIPAGLGDVNDSDLTQLGLPICSDD